MEEGKKYGYFFVVCSYSKRPLNAYDKHKMSTGTSRGMRPLNKQGSLKRTSLYQFNIYRKLLGEIAWSFAQQCNQNANEIQLYFTLTAELDGSVEGWNMKKVGMRTNKLKLNPDKTEVLLLVNARAARGLRSQPILKGAVLPLKEQLHSLEILLDTD